MRTLLIVDDQEGVLTALGYVFTECGYRTLVANSGPAALNVVSGESFDAALVDLHMPGMDGLAVCASLRVSSPTTPLWIMTAACTREVEGKAREVGIVAVLRKPFDVPEFTRDLESRLATPGLATTGSTSGTEHVA